MPGAPPRRLSGAAGRLLRPVGWAGAGDLPPHEDDRPDVPGGGRRHGPPGRPRRRGSRPAAGVGSGGGRDPAGDLRADTPGPATDPGKVRWSMIRLAFYGDDFTGSTD